MPDFRALSVASLFVAIAPPVIALECPGPENIIAVGQVAEALSGNVLALKDGRIIRLFTIEVPSRPLEQAQTTPHIAAEAARDLLQSLAAGKQLEVIFADTTPDRHGRIPAIWTRTSDGTWLEAALLARGEARIGLIDTPDAQSCLPALRSAEASARQDRLGLWADPDFGVQKADEPSSILPLTGSFAVVEGTVKSAARAGSRVYLNFSGYWKTDFTIVIDAGAQKRYEELGLDPLDLNGKYLRVRGWIEAADGPRINLHDPAQIELLPAR